MRLKMCCSTRSYALFSSMLAKNFERSSGKYEQSRYHQRPSAKLERKRGNNGGQQVGHYDSEFETLTHICRQKQQKTKNYYEVFDRMSSTLAERPTFSNEFLRLKLPNFLYMAPQPVKQRLATLRRGWIRQQFRNALYNGGDEESEALFYKFLDSEIVEDANFFTEELVAYKLSTLDYGNAFVTWSRKMAIERTFAGADVLLEYIVLDKKESELVRQCRIKAVFNGLQRIATPSIALAECVSAYVSTGHWQEAIVLAKNYVIQPRSFTEPLRRLGDRGNVKAVESFAHFIEEIYKPTNKRTKGSAALPMTDFSDEQELENSAAYQNVKVLLQPPKRRKKYRPKKPKIKRYEVDQRQLNVLLRMVVEVWIDVADRQNNFESLDKLYLFIERNELTIRRAQVEFIAQTLRRNSLTPESNVNPFTKFLSGLD